jgi:hypothetical protein
MSQDSFSEMDLPKPLMMMLGTLLCQYDIKNWSIYSNNNQNTCVVIRFSDTDGCTQPAQYKRISDNQLARSKARSDSYKQNRMQNMNSIDNSKCKKRKCDKMQDSSPEILRVQPDSDVLNICDINSPDTPIKADMFQSNACHEDLHRYPDSPCSDNHITDAFHNTPSVSSVVSEIFTTPEPPVIESAQSPSNSYPVVTTELLDCSIPDYHIPDVIEAPTSYEVSPTIVPSTNYHTAVHCPRPVINSEPVVAFSTLSPNCLTPTESDNEKTLPLESNVIYCQCCESIMSPTHTCLTENDTPSPPSPPNEIPPDPGPSQTRPSDDAKDTELLRADCKDPELLQILCSVIGKFKR